MTNLKNLKMLLTILFLVGAFFLIIELAGFDVSLKNFDEKDYSEMQKHLEFISKEKHLTSSDHHSLIQNYIEKEISKYENLKMITQQARVSSNIGGVEIKNILAVKEGVSDKGAIMISSHYDSAYGSYGANDAGVAISAMLSQLEELNSYDNKRTIIFNFIDGEEIGIVGSKYFVENFDELGLPEIEYNINLEARGAGGAPYIFETTNLYDSEVALFNKKLSYVSNNSFAEKIYKRLPNDSDVTFYKTLGIKSFNIGYFEGLCAYHTEDDTFENTQKNTKLAYISIIKDSISAFDTVDIPKENFSLVHYTIIPGLNINHSSVIFYMIFFLNFIGFVVLFKKQNKKNFIKTLITTTLLVLIYFSANLLMYFVTSRTINFFTEITVKLILFINIITIPCIIFLLRKYVKNLNFIWILLFLNVLSLILMIVIKEISYLILIPILIITLGKILETLGYQLLNKTTQIILFGLIVIPVIYTFSWIFDNRLITFIIFATLSSYFNMLILLTSSEIKN